MAYIIIAPIVVVIGLFIAYACPDTNSGFAYGDESEDEYKRMMESARKLNIRK